MKGRLEVDKDGSLFSWKDFVMWHFNVDEIALEEAMKFYKQWRLGKDNPTKTADDSDRSLLHPPS